MFEIQRRVEQTQTLRASTVARLEHHRERQIGWPYPAGRQNRTAWRRDARSQQMLGGRMLIGRQSDKLGAGAQRLTAAAEYALDTPEQNATTLRPDHDRCVGSAPLVHQKRDRIRQLKRRRVRERPRGAQVKSGGRARWRPRCSRAVRSRWPARTIAAPSPASAKCSANTGPPAAFGNKPPPVVYSKMKTRNVTGLIGARI